MTNPFRDQEKFMRACDQTVGGEFDEDQFNLYVSLIEEETNELAEAIAALDIKPKTEAAAVSAELTATLRTFIDRVYFEVRNLGRLSADRALNFAATNAFQAAQVFSETFTSSMRLDTIDVERSPYARPDSDAWDIKLKFFDPENTRRARTVFRFTIDVSDIMPVTIGEIRSWSTSS
jgi:hypothetical protein